MDSESGSRSNSAADSYIGSLISLTSKSEIRYEGVLYNINTDESSLGLRNVRSLGTEGRKKDGPQVPPSDRVFEYILFRGSDIKDLHVKSSTPVQTTSLINNDPAIIQSHYPCPVSTSPSMPSPVSGSSLTDINSQAVQMGIPGSNFQGGLPLYQPGGNLGFLGASPPPPPTNPSGGGLAVPMYWQGYYAPPNGLPHMHQQSLLRPPPGLSLPASLQQPVQYPNLTTSVATGAPNLLDVSSSLFSVTPSLSSTSMPPLTISPTLSSSVLSVPQTSEMSSSSMINKTLNSALPPPPLSANFPSLSPLSTTSSDVSFVVPPPNKATSLSGLTYQTVSPPTPAIVGTSNSVLTSAPAPTLVTPGQLLQTTGVSPSLTLRTAQKDVEVVKASSSLAAEPTASVSTDAQPPILPLPVSTRPIQMPNGSTSQPQQVYRGRGRGRRSWNSHQTERFTEDFDFMAMNEKFNKDEVWGHLGKNAKLHSKSNDEDEKFSDEDDNYEEDDGESSKSEMKPVYNKDDFFDTLSCNTLDNQAQNGRRPRYYEQMKLDTETFGDFSRHQGGRGGWARGGGRRGGYYGRGYGQVGRGRGRYHVSYNM